MKERALAAESYLSSLEQELQLHKEIAPQLQVASSSNRWRQIAMILQGRRASDGKEEKGPSKLDDFLQNARYIYILYT